MEQPPWVEIGRVRSVAPGRRALRVTPGPLHGAAMAGRTWVRAVCGPQTLRLPLAAAERAGDAWVLTAGPGVPVEVVAGLRGASICVPAGELPQRPAGAWRLRDLCGLTALDAQGAAAGMIGGVYETAAHGAFELKRPDGRVVLLPAIPAVVTAVDLAAGTVTLGDWAPYAVDHAD